MNPPRSPNSVGQSSNQPETKRPRLAKTACSEKNRVILLPKRKFTTHLKQNNPTSQITPMTNEPETENSTQPKKDDLTARLDAIRLECNTKISDLEKIILDNNQKVDKNMMENSSKIDQIKKMVEESQKSSSAELSTMRDLFQQICDKLDNTPNREQNNSGSNPQPTTSNSTPNVETNTINNSENVSRKDSTSVISYQIADQAANFLKIKNDKVTVELIANNGPEFTSNNKYHPHRFVKIFESNTANTDIDDKCKTILFRKAIKVDNNNWIQRSADIDNYDKLKEIFLSIFWSEVKQNEALEFFKQNRGEPGATLLELIDDLEMWSATMKQMEDLSAKKRLRHLFKKLPREYKNQISCEELSTDEILFKQLKKLSELEDGMKNDIQPYVTRIWRNQSRNQGESDTQRQTDQHNQRSETQNYEQRGRGYGRYNYRNSHRGNYSRRGNYNTRQDQPSNSGQENSQPPKNGQQLTSATQQ